MTANDIRAVEAEAGVVATVLKHPEYTFYSENLSASYFTDTINKLVYFAAQQLAKNGVEKMDAFNIRNFLQGNRFAKDKIEVKNLEIETLEKVIETADLIARDTVPEYTVLVKNVIDAAMRRETWNKLSECQRLCTVESEERIEEKIYKTLDDVVMKFSSVNEVPQMKDCIDTLWQKIKLRQNSDLSAMQFKIPLLNQFATIDRGELFIFAAEQKQGKSMMLLNCAVDLLRKNKAVLYIDSELNSELFTCRLLSHLTQIDFKRIRSGDYSEAEEQMIDRAREWIKTRKFTHIYLPAFDAQSIYAVTKKVKHTQGIDVLIVDYFKASDEADAFAVYAGLGETTNLVKNRIAGEMDIAAIGAVQATSTGKIADSSRIGRNASTIALISDKTPEEIEQDGKECGNKKLRIVFNRNGAQMSPGEYIDLNFNGNIILYEQAKKQHANLEAY